MCVLCGRLLILTKLGIAAAENCNRLLNYTVPAVEYHGLVMLLAASCCWNRPHPTHCALMLWRYCGVIRWWLLRSEDGNVEGASARGVLISHANRRHHSHTD
jgi:hypothetical protein